MSGTGAISAAAAAPSTVNPAASPSGTFDQQTGQSAGAKSPFASVSAGHAPKSTMFKDLMQLFLAIELEDEMIAANKKVLIIEEQAAHAHSHKHASIAYQNASALNQAGTTSAAAAVTPSVAPTSSLSVAA